MSLSAAEAAIIAGQFPDVRALTVVDLRGPEAAWYDVYRRDWAEFGVVVRPTRPPAASGPVALLVASGADDESASAAFDAIDPAAHEFAVLVEASDRTWTRRGVPIAPPWPVHLAPTSLVLNGREPIRLLVPHLPATIILAAPGHHAGHTIQVTGRHPTEHLPLPNWFQLPFAAPSQEFQIGIRPGRDGDSWAIASTNGAAARPLVRPPEPHHLERLILIVDRTCPDAECWEDARSLIVEGPDEYKEPKPPNLNLAIRRGLAKGLRQAASSSPFEVDVIWFADVAGGGLVSPSGVELASHRASRSSVPIRADRVEATIMGLTYWPGLDLWDALDDGLALAFRLAQQRGPTPVLIVGNSPPHVPLDPESPFRVLLERHGRRSAYRHRGHYHEHLNALQDLGCPVACLFLDGHEVPVGFEGFRDVQACVHDAFAQGMRVIVARPDEPGVADGVVETIALLADSTSAVYRPEARR